MKKILVLTLFTVLCLNYLTAQEIRSFKIHSHNDYLRNVPFWEAFGAGCGSIEADVILSDGELMVAHESSSIIKKRTLRSLYLNPIMEGIELGLISDFEFHLLL